MRPQGRVIPAAEEPQRGSNPTGGRPARARAVGRKPWRREGHESCRRTGRVKPAGERGAPGWAQSSRVGLSPRWKPVCFTDEGPRRGNGRGKGRSPAARARESLPRRGRMLWRAGNGEGARGWTTIDDHSGVTLWRPKPYERQRGETNPRVGTAVRPAGRLRIPVSGEPQGWNPAGHGGRWGRWKGPNPGRRRVPSRSRRVECPEAEPKPRRGYWWSGHTGRQVIVSKASKAMNVWGLT